MIDIKKAEKEADFEKIASLAFSIWTEHYTPIIGIDQVNYMLSKFQSAAAIKEQVLEGMEYYTIYSEETPAGYFAISRKEQDLFLSKLYVSSQFRGKGLAKAAMTFIGNRKQELECNSITLTVNKYNTNSINAYFKMGFEKVKSIIQDIGNGYIMDDYLMQKKDWYYQTQHEKGHNTTHSHFHI